MKRFFFVLVFIFSVHSYGSDKIQLLVTEEITCGKKPDVVLLHDLLDSNGAVLVKKSTPVVYGLDCRHPGNVGKGGVIQAVFGYIDDINGKAIMFKGDLQSHGASRFDLSIGLTFGLMPILGPFSPLFLLIKGDNTSVAKGTVIEVDIDTNCDDFFSDMENRQLLVKAAAEGV